MSPEIQLGDEFDLPTDIFSFGVILGEIAARKLADDYTFKRAAPTFGIDTQEVRDRANPGCPEAFIQLCLDCLAVQPAARPTTRVILERLSEIEAEVLSHTSEKEDMHVGSVKFMASRRPTAPRIPSFGMGVGPVTPPTTSEEETTSSDDELMEAVIGLNAVHVGGSDISNTATSGKHLLHPFLKCF